MVDTRIPVTYGMRTGEVINSLNLIADNGLENHLDRERMVVRALLVLT